MDVDVMPARRSRGAGLTSVLWHSCRRAAEALWLPAALVVLWLVVSADSTGLYFPPLTKILDNLVHEWFGTFLTSDVLPSFVILLQGLLTGIAAGVVIGYAIGSVPLARQVLGPLVDLTRSVPVVALIPLFISVFGLGTTPEYVVITWASFWPVLLNTIDGVRRIERGYLETARVVRLSVWQRFALVRIPAASPQIMAGVATSVGLAVIAMVAIEMFASQRGIGFQLDLASRNFVIASTYSGAIVAGLIGYLLATTVALADRFLLRWHHQPRAAQARRTDLTTKGRR
jgi:sulfonate transport system permease protein